MPGVEQDPVRPAPVAAQFHVVIAAGGACLTARRERLRAVALAARLEVFAAAALAQRAQAAARDLGQTQAGALRLQLRDQPCGVVVERDLRAADRRQAVAGGVLQQRLDQLGGGVGREAQPPLAVGAHEVEHALVPAPARAAARERARELIADLGLAGEAREQAGERLGALGVERDAPRPADRVPAPSRDRAQELAQPLVVREAQDGFAGGDRGVEVEGHEHRTIGRDGDETRARARLAL